MPPSADASNGDPARPIAERACGSPVIERGADQTSQPDARRGRGAHDVSVQRPIFARADKRAPMPFGREKAAIRQGRYR